MGVGMEELRPEGEKLGVEPEELVQERGQVGVGMEELKPE